MKEWIFVASLAVLAGCSQAEDGEATAEPAEVAVAEPAPALAADGRPAPGNYRITTAEGMVFMEEVKPDGTYIQTDEDGQVVETGLWDQRSPEQYCYTVDAAYVDEDTPADQQCNTEQVGDDGVWSTTNPEGETATVERVEA